MASSSEIAILMKVAELVQRFGLRASDYDATLGYVDEQIDPNGKGYSCLAFDSAPTDAELSEKVDKVKKILGIENGLVKREGPQELEDLLDDAIARAPRARIR